MHYRSKIISAAHSPSHKRIAFFNADITEIKAACFLRDNTSTSPVLIGNPFSLRDLADTIRVSLKNIEIVNTKSLLLETPANRAHLDPLIINLLAKFDNETIIKSPLLLNLAVAGTGVADAYITPYNIHLWKLIQTINPELNNKISGFHLLFSESAQKAFLFSDTCINAFPTSETLAETAIRAAYNFTKITGQTAKTALLSFSTKGSAKHKIPDAVRQAADIVKQKAPQLIIDGEIQFDAAAVLEIGEQKAPGNVLKGETNVFIFPNLDSARIGYQIARSVAAYMACGGFIQGFNLPLIFADTTTDYMELVETALIAGFYLENEKNQE